MSHDLWTTPFAAKRAVEELTSHVLKSVEDVKTAAHVVVVGVGDSIKFIPAGRIYKVTAGKNVPVGRFDKHLLRKVGGASPAPPAPKSGKIVLVPGSVAGVAAKAVLDAISEAQLAQEQLVSTVPAGQPAAPVLHLIGEVTEVRRGKIIVHTADPAQPGEDIEVTLRASDLPAQDRELLSRPGAIVELVVHDRDGQFTFEARPFRRQAAQPDQRLTSA